MYRFAIKCDHLLRSDGREKDVESHGRLPKNELDKISQSAKAFSNPPEHPLARGEGILLSDPLTVRHLMNVPKKMVITKSPWLSGIFSGALRRCWDEAHSSSPAKVARGCV